MIPSQTSSSRDTGFQRKSHGTYTNAMNAQNTISALIQDGRPAKKSSSQSRTDPPRGRSRMAHRHETGEGSAWQGKFRAASESLAQRAEGERRRSGGRARVISG